jgi:tetratricopeptide (TPR) repeat protein
LYQKALKLDPSQVAAAVNLGNLFIKGGQAREAIRLWQYALEKSPGLETVRLSLAVALYRSGDSAAAEGSLTKLLELNPANTVARRLLSEVRSRR